MVDKIKLALRKIDNEFETPQLLSNVVSFLTQNEQKRRECLSLLKTAVRYFCFMDLFQETGDEDYRVESERQKISLYNNLDQKHKQKLERVKNEIILNYWDLEKTLKTRIRDISFFSEEEIEDYILKKSGDALFYGTIMSFYCNLPLGLIEVIHNRQALADLVDDVLDYEEDLKSGQPNIIILYFLNQGVSNHSTNFKHAIEKSKELGNTERIIRFGRRLYQTAIDVEGVKQIIPLKQSVEVKYKILIRLLDND